MSPRQAGVIAKGVFPRALGGWQEKVALKAASQTLASRAIPGFQTRTLALPGAGGGNKGLAL